MAMTTDRILKASMLVSIATFAITVSTVPASALQATPRKPVAATAPAVPATAAPRPAPDQGRLMSPKVQLMRAAKPIACGSSVQNLVIGVNTSGRGMGDPVDGLCLQIVSNGNGAVIWEGLNGPGGNVSLRRLPYTGGGITLRSKQAGLLGNVVIDDHVTAFGNSHVAMAQLQAGIFGSVYFGNGSIQGEFSDSLYDPKTDTHTFSPSPLPNGCGSWTETSVPVGATNALDAAMASVFFVPYTASLTAPPSGTVLGYNYVKIPGGRCWLGGAGSAVAGVPVSFSWGPTTSLTAAYTIQNGQIVDVEEAESAQMEAAMLALGFNPGQSTLKYSGSATTDASGNFAIPYTVETLGLGVVSVRRRGYRISKVHKTQGGFRLWQRIDGAGPKAPNKNGDCLTGKAVVASDGQSLDITYRFKGSAC
jgi:hypothetical protein